MSSVLRTSKCNNISGNNEIFQKNNTKQGSNSMGFLPSFYYKPSIGLLCKTTDIGLNKTGKGRYVNY